MTKEQEELVCLVGYATMTVIMGFAIGWTTGSDDRQKHMNEVLYEDTSRAYWRGYNEGVKSVQPTKPEEKGTAKPWE